MTLIMSGNASDINADELLDRWRALLLEQHQTKSKLMQQCMKALRDLKLRLCQPANVSSVLVAKPEKS